MKRSDITNLIPDATDELINKIMDLNGGDINAAKKGVDDLKKQLEESTAKIKALEAAQQAAAGPADELRTAVERVAALEAQLNGMQQAEEARKLRESVAKDTGIPAHLLTGDTEEGLREQARLLAEFKNEKAYPVLRDGGEAKTAASAAKTTATRDRFAAWAADNL